MWEVNIRHFIERSVVNYKGYFVYKWFAHIHLVLSGVEDVGLGEDLIESFSFTI